MRRDGDDKQNIFSHKITRYGHENQVLLLDRTNVMNVKINPMTKEYWSVATCESLRDHNLYEKFVKLLKFPNSQL